MVKQMLTTHSINPFEYIQIQMNDNQAEIIQNEGIYVQKKWKIWSPFHYAVHYDKLELVEMFLMEEPFASMFDAIVLRQPPTSNTEFHLIAQAEEKDDCGDHMVIKLCIKNQNAKMLDLILNRFQ